MPDATCFLFRAVRKSVYVANSLRIVLDHKQVVFCSYIHDFCHICCMTIKMHRNDCFCFGRNGFLNCPGIHAKCFWIYFYKHRLYVQQCGNFYGSYVSKGRSDHFITRLQTQRHHCNLQRICSVSTRDHMFASVVVGKVAGEIGYHFATNEL